MALTQPLLAARTCGECAKWMYDRDGRRRLRRDGKPDPRPPGVPTPCGTCPKRSPREAHRYELSEKNLRAVECYFETRATQGRSVPDWLAADPLFAEVMARIDGVVSALEKQQASTATAATLARVLAKGKPDGR